MIDLTNKEKSLIDDAIQKFSDDYPDYKLLFLTVSGSHIYGTKDEKVDSDIDLRGAFVVPTEEILGTKSYPKCIDHLNYVPSVDFSVQEIGKFTKELLSPNMNYIEMVKSPIVIIEPPKELVQLADGLISKQLFHHIQGFSIHTWKHAVAENWNRPKRILYLYRDLLRGILLFDGKPFMSDVRQMGEDHGDLNVMGSIISLIELKKNGDSPNQKQKEIFIEELRDLQEKMSLLNTYGTLKKESLLENRFLNNFLLKIRVENFKRYQLVSSIKEAKEGF